MNAEWYKSHRKTCPECQNDFEYGTGNCILVVRMWEDEQWFNSYSWGQHLEKDEVNQLGQE